MTRAAGKHGPRAPEVSDDEKKYIGADIQVPGPQRDIPGGETHIIEKVLPPPTKPAVQAKRSPFRGIEAHGVDPQGGHWDRPGHQGDAKAYVPEYAKPVIPPVPVPVYIVESAVRRVRKLATVRRFQVNVAGGQPIRIGADDEQIISIKVLNEGVSMATGVRIAQDQASLVSTHGGALLPDSMTSYLKIETQSELWVVSDDSNQPYISVIIEQEVDAG
jgi:hypothetical protein